MRCVRQACRTQTLFALPLFGFVTSTTPGPNSFMLLAAAGYCTLARILIQESLKSHRMFTMPDALCV